ncbi:MAG: hypothetical protein HYY23_16150 [Verrucomicrobia bacterium]|nr:hypothetical protein [Verrucomicrobiota bacterium]
MKHEIHSRSSSRRGLRTFWFGLAISVIGIACFGIWQNRRADRQLEAIRKAGSPVSLAELNDWYPAVTVGENAAFKIMEAAAQLAAPVTSFSGETPLTPDVRDQLNRFWTNNQTALNLAHEAAGLKQCRYLVDLNLGANTLLPHLSQIKQLVQQLRNVAILHADEGRLELALQSYRDALAISQSIAQEPLLISQLVRIACVAIAQSALEKILARHELTESQLEALSTALRDAESLGRPSFTRGLAGERCLGVHAFRMPPSQFVRMMDPSAGRGPTFGFSVLLALTKITGLRSRDFSFYRQIMQDWIDSSELPFPEALEKSKEAGLRLTTGLQGPSRLLRPFSGMLLPAMEKALAKEAASTALLRGAQTALAIERHRLQNHGQLPESLEALVPQLIASVPRDPFDGRPLRYKKLEKGYAVYSVGNNGKDDGGVSKSGLDVAFRVER